ncbi:aminotransferase class I/II-fold pyridoxal phosphate-dependent enzyme [Cryptosporangium sp. NPDC048952]|uniref:aminotransferase class I/II-fold pyridoxal phosphate-dependent enzyme n=1 Tax=Cryptosporangium sp. NPDC048952 TaxID=3363961 RepID=UPI0037169F62
MTLASHAATANDADPLNRTGATNRDLSGPASHHHAVPLVEAIIRYRGLETGALHVPGHYGGDGPGTDELRELLGSDLLASDIWLTTGELAAARAHSEALAAKAWGADAAWFLLNGSSGGNHALHLAQPGTPHGRHVVLARDSHTSTLAGLILSGATPHWVPPRLDTAGFGISLGVHPADLDAALRTAVANGRAANLVSIASPGYIGVCADIPALAQVAHRYGAPLAVDEAWGAHLPFHPDLPTHAIGAGADIAVASAHKMLPALSGAALILARRGRTDLPRLDRAVRMIQTTSPLLPTLASIDQARHTMVTHGTALLDRALELAHSTRQQLATIPGIRVAEPGDLGVPANRFDPLRLVIEVAGLGITGLAVEHWLREPGPVPQMNSGRHTRQRPAIAVEGADTDHLYIVIGAATRPRTIEALIDALRHLAAKVPVERASSRADHSLVTALLAPRELVCTPREAHFAPIDVVPLSRALGRISAEAITPYPPGVPAVMPGERLDRDTLHALAYAARTGMHFHGTADPKLNTLGVVRT